MNLISKNLSQLRRIALAVLLASFAILETPSISAQEPGRTITSPFGIARQTSSTESGSDGDTFVDPETGEVGHITRNPFGVANPDGIDTGIDIPDRGEEEVGGIITNPFGVPASDDIDTGVDVFDEDEEYLIRLPDDEESDAEDAEDMDAVDDETSDGEKTLEDESEENTTEKVLPVIDNPTRGVEYTIELSLTGSTGPAAEQYRVESTAGNIYAAPTLYVAPGGKLTLTVASTDNQTLVKENISFYFDGTLDTLSEVFENKQYLSGSSSSSSHVFRYNVSDNVSPNVVCNPHNVAVLYRYNNNVTIARYLRIEIKVFSILIDSNNDGAINSKDEATKKSGKLIHTNNLDIDRDGIPDFADGFDCTNGGTTQNSASQNFTPLTVRISKHLNIQNCSISFHFSEAEYQAVPYSGNGINTYVPYRSKTLRLWTKDGSLGRLKAPINASSNPGNSIPSQTQSTIPLSTFISACNAANSGSGVPNNNGGSSEDDYLTYTLYVEAVRPCASAVGENIELCLIYTGASSVMKDNVVVIPYQIVLEGITTKRNNDGILYNPCGIERGKSATFRFDTLPEDINCDDIAWSSKNSLLTFEEEEPKGRIVTVTANGTAGSDYELIVDIGRDSDSPFYKRNPRIKGTILEPQREPVKLYIWVVRDENRNPAFSEDKIEEWVNKANLIFEQVAIDFKIEETRFINADDDNGFWTISKENLSQLTSYPSTLTNYSRGEGLEIFFVHEVTFAAGVSVPAINGPNSGIVVGAGRTRNNGFINAVSTTLAHELGHACGLEDIYVSGGSGSINISSNINPSSKWLKKDCTAHIQSDIHSVAGYYQFDIKHVNLIKRLIMFGGAASADVKKERADISLDEVYGVKRNYTNNTYSYDYLMTGLKNLKRPPKPHPL